MMAVCSLLLLKMKDVNVFHFFLNFCYLWLSVNTEQFNNNIIILIIIFAIIIIIISIII